MNGAALLHAAVEFLVPTKFWVAAIACVLSSLLPSPLQPLLLSVLNRGKLLQPSSSLRMTVPHKLFFHFYLVGTFFNGIILLMLISYIYVRPSSLSGFNIEHAWEAISILFLFEVHVMRRLYESMYISKFGEHARMHIIAYLFGLMYYVLAPLSLFPRAVDLIASGYSDFKHFFDMYELETKDKNDLCFLSWHYSLGAAIFIWGSIHQYRCHCILASLKENGISGKENSQYKVPYGDWFEYVSCAHYLAEFVIYVGFIVAIGGSNLGAWLLFVYVVLNLSIAATETQKWYRKMLRDYPLHRKAIIPYVY